MKKSLCLLLAMSFGILMTVQAQQALYVHKNNSDEYYSTSEAYLPDEIQSISFTEAYGGKYQQRIILKDGSKKNIYCPVSSIDSVSFTPPHPELTENGMILDNTFAPYISDADTLKFTMAKDTPAEKLPKVGNVVSSTFDNTAFPDGIMARVTTITETADGYLYECKKAGVDDLYDSFLYYGYSEGTGEAASRRATQTDEAADEGLNLWDKSIDFPLNNVFVGDYTFGGNLHLGSKGNLLIKMIKEKGYKAQTTIRFKHHFEGKFSSSIAMKKATDFGGKIPISPTFSFGAIPTPIPGIFFTPFVKFYFYGEAAADLKATFGAHMNIDNDFCATLKDNRWTVEEGKNMFDAGIDEASISIDGWIGMGIQPEFLITLCGSQTGAVINTRAGIRLNGTAKFDFVDFMQEASFYDALKDSRITFSVPIQAWFNAQLGFLGPSIKSADLYFVNKDFPIAECFLVPSFSSVGAMLTPTGARATVNLVNRTVLGNVYLGISAYDKKNNLVDTKWVTNYHKYSDLENGSYSADFTLPDWDELDEELEYTFMPVVRVMGVETKTSQTAKISRKEFNPVDAVDLGLPSGLLWAGWNVGATKPEEYGNYYSWGETRPFSPDNEYLYLHEYIAWDPATEAMWNYWNNELIARYGHGADGWYLYIYDDLGTNISGSMYDAARGFHGGGWRMPSVAEWQELFDNCTRKYTTYKDVKGTLFTGPNGNSVFFPAAGLYQHQWNLGWTNVGAGSYYWTSDLELKRDGTRYEVTAESGARKVGFPNASSNSSNRGDGLSVRAVKGGR